MLKNDKELNLSGTDSEKELEISRLFSIISDKNVATHIESPYSPDTIEKNDKTLHFHKNGGFMKVFQVESKRISDEEQFRNLTTEKLKTDLKLSKRQVITFWISFFIGVGGFIFGILNVIDSKSDKKSIEVLQQDILILQSEVTKLHTLALDREKVDSLYTPKTNNILLKK